MEQEVYIEKTVGAESRKSIHSIVCRKNPREGIQFNGPLLKFPFVGHLLGDALFLLSQNHQVKTLKFSFIGDESVRMSTQFFLCQILSPANATTCNGNWYREAHHLANAGHADSSC